MRAGDYGSHFYIFPADRRTTRREASQHDHEEPPAKRRAARRSRMQLDEQTTSRYITGRRNQLRDYQTGGSR